jgi:hypothetical protein
MTRHRGPSTTALAILLVTLASAGVPAPAADDAMRPIFDGKTTQGWLAPDPSYWSVEDGAITARITKEHPLSANQYLVWQGGPGAEGGQLADFELVLKSRVRGEGGINNGFQFRSLLLPDGDVAGYQVDNNLQTPWLVRLYDEFGRHTLAWRGQRTTFDDNGKSVSEDIADAKGDPWFKLEAWHEYRLVCRGETLTLSVDGRLAAEVIDHDARRRDDAGILALQLHSGPPTVAQFKDIRLKILKPAPDANVQRTPADERRAAIFHDAVGHWDLSVGGRARDRERSLTYRGPLEDAELNVRAGADAPRPDARVALLRGGYFDAGAKLNVTGDRATVYLRVRDPAGAWDGALMAKRGSHDTTNFNLYSLAGRIGFELHGDGGFVGVDFPASKVDARAWHDLVGRYDGKKVELLCDGKVMAEKPWAGGKLTTNAEPLLIGAETDAGKAVRPFHGEIEEAAVWAGALSDDEVAALSRR